MSVSDQTYFLKCARSMLIGLVRARTLILGEGRHRQELDRNAGALALKPLGVGERSGPALQL